MSDITGTLLSNAAMTYQSGVDMSNNANSQENAQTLAASFKQAQQAQMQATMMNLSSQIFETGLKAQSNASEAMKNVSDTVKM
jgi:hypothetical protein